MRIVSVQEMKEIEKIAFQKYKISETQIIENVGRECAQFIEENILDNDDMDDDYDVNFEPDDEDEEMSEPPIKKNFVVLLGKGNNAADGLSVARELKKRRHQVAIYLLFTDEKSYSPQMTKFLRKAREMRITQIKDISHIDFEQTIIIDAIFGTGVQYPLPKEVEQLLFFLRENFAEVISLDIPSGVDPNTGKASPFAIEAENTIAIGCPKIGHFVGEGRKLRGILDLVSGGLPFELCFGDCFYPDGKGFFQINDMILLQQNPRDDFAHKGNFGHVGIVGGSRRYSGAPILAATAALRSGVGLVTIITPESSLLPIMSRTNHPEIMFLSTQEAIKENLFSQMNTLVVGPGLGLGAETKSLLNYLFDNYKGKLILDADALNALEGDDSLMVKLKNYKGGVVLTPHLGEMVRHLGNCTVEELDHLKGIEKVKNFAQSLGHFILLKSAISSFYTGKGKVYFIDGANSGLAKGGSGDALAGVIAGFMASGIYSTIEEAVLGALVVRQLASEKALLDNGERAMLPTDVINCIGRYDL